MVDTYVVPQVRVVQVKVEKGYSVSGEMPGGGRIE